MSLDRRDIKRKKKRKKRVITWILFPIIVVFLSAASYAGFLYYKAQAVMGDSYNPLNRESKRSTQVNPEIDNISVLFVGIDDSKKRNFQDSTRTDALMLATFNKDMKSVQLLSIPRDSLVYIPEKGYEDKINHAYGAGGIESTIETVEGLLDVPVDYYVKMNFDAFIDVIDALGGIEAEVPYTLNEKNSRDISNAIHLEPGYQELNGEEALALARTRKQDNDIERGKRQQDIIKAIMKKSVSVKSMHKYSDVIEAVGKNMETDLSFDEMTSFVDYLTAGRSLNVDTITLEGQDATIDGVYYYQLNEEELYEIQNNLKVHLNVPGAISADETEDNESDTEY